MKQLILLLWLVVPVMAVGQKIDSVRASRQIWAGGMCCATGTNYGIILFTDSLTTKAFTVDSIYISNYAFTAGGITIQKHGKTITMQCGISYNRYEEIDTKIEKVVTYNFPDKIVYHIGKKRYELLIPRFEELFPIAYP